MKQRTILAAMTAGLMLAALGATHAEPLKVERTLEFATEMARKGNWREAQYRWNQVAAERPDNPRILNNLAVAAEILGDLEVADRHYRRALSLAPGDARIEENSRRFYRFASLAAEGRDGGAAEAESALPAVSTTRRKKKKHRGGSNAIRIVASFPLPPRLDLADYENLLVASFLTEETDLLNTNREITRFLRIEFRKRSPLKVLEVTPAPAIPEQTLEDLLANREFWKHLGREYGADLIVSGAVAYTRQDSSGYRDVDVVSRITGQKVRETRFVEQEQFTYSMDVFFMDGRTGTLRFRDRLQQSALYPGTTNDPLTAFYGLVESIARDVIAVVSPRSREDTRIVFAS